MLHHQERLCKRVWDYLKYSQKYATDLLLMLRMELNLVSVERLLLDQVHLC